MQLLTIFLGYLNALLEYIDYFILHVKHIHRKTGNKL